MTIMTGGGADIKRISAWLPWDIECMRGKMGCALPDTPSLLDGQYTVGVKRCS
jgi:hypothetical protein